MWSVHPLLEVAAGCPDLAVLLRISALTPMHAVLVEHHRVSDNLSKLGLANDLPWTFVRFTDITAGL